jgi:hypothetical protein
MPWIKPTSKAVRRAYRQKLRPEQRGPFDALGKLINEPRFDLDWYHAVGTQVARLIPSDMPQHGRVRWLEGPAKALGPSVEFLQKALMFHDLYPHPRAYRVLKDMHVDWTRLYVVFAVRDREARHRLLREALRKGWNIPQLRFRVQERYTGPQHRRGGRPRRQLPCLSPEATLRELERLSRHWLEFQEQSWATVTATDWKQFLREWPPDDRDRLCQILKNADRKVAQLIAAGEAVRPCLADMLRKV